MGSESVGLEMAAADMILMFERFGCVVWLMKSERTVGSSFRQRKERNEYFLFDNQIQ
jgi:hypothetical protein